MIIHMKRSNINACPHAKEHANTIRTSDGRTAILCPACLTDLEGRLSDPVLIRGMLKATMTTAEVQKMRHERENMAIENALSDTVAAAFAVAGYPRHLQLASPVA